MRMHKSLLSDKSVNYQISILVDLDQIQYWLMTKPQFGNS